MQARARGQPAPSSPPPPLHPPAWRRPPVAAPDAAQPAQRLAARTGLPAHLQAHLRLSPPPLGAHLGAVLSQLPGQAALSRSHRPLPWLSLCLQLLLAALWTAQAQRLLPRWQGHPSLFTRPPSDHLVVTVLPRPNLSQHMQSTHASSAPRHVLAEPGSKAPRTHLWSC